MFDILSNKNSICTLAQEEEVANATALGAAIKLRLIGNTIGRRGREKNG